LINAITERCHKAILGSYRTSGHQARFQLLCSSARGRTPRFQSAQAAETLQCLAASCIPLSASKDDPLPCFLILCFAFATSRHLKRAHSEGFGGAPLSQTQSNTHSFGLVLEDLNSPSPFATVSSKQNLCVRRLDVEGGIGETKCRRRCFCSKFFGEREKVVAAELNYRGKECCISFTLCCDPLAEAILEA